MLLAILQCTGQPPEQRIIQPKWSTMPTLRNPDPNQSQNNIFVKMELFRYLLQLRVTPLLWSCQNFESFKINNEAEVPKLKETFESKSFLSTASLFSVENNVAFAGKMTFIKGPGKSAFPTLLVDTEGVAHCQTFSDPLYYLLE